MLRCKLLCRVSGRLGHAVWSPDVSLWQRVGVASIADWRPLMNGRRTWTWMRRAGRSQTAPTNLESAGPWAENYRAKHTRKSRCKPQIFRLFSTRAAFNLLIYQEKIDKLGQIEYELHHSIEDHGGPTVSATRSRSYEGSDNQRNGFDDETRRNI